MEGAAIANAVTFALSKWARLALVRRFVHIQPYDRDYLRVLPATVASLGVMWLVHSAVTAKWFVDLALTGLAGGVVFAAGYLLFGMTPAEKRGIGMLRARLTGRA
jgi:hypothetical protein